MYAKVPCFLCKTQIWRSPAELGAADDALAAGPTNPGRFCGACRTGKAPLIGECSVCFATEPLMPYYDPKAGTDVCTHRFCLPCWTSHLETALGEGRSVVRCMGERCAHFLGERDIKRLSPALFKGFVQLKYADYEARLREVFLFDDQFATWARRNTQGCPRCHVLVQRSEG
jgi:hypothetical protein